jgi:transcriptional regulator with XRE-family HTH domain
MDEAVAQVMERIRELRIENGLSLVELANRANVARSHLFYIEAKRKIPNLTTLHKLAVAMDLSMRDFFD